jgi:hypothetical protein
VASVSQASQTAGNFSDDDRKLYIKGVAFAARTHAKLGSFTIAQIVDQEAAREQSRANAVEYARHKAAQAANDARDARVSARANDVVNAEAAEFLSGTSSPAVASVELDGKTLTLKTDADLFSNFSSQDQTLVSKQLWLKWNNCYNRHHGIGPVNSSVILRIVNLNENDIGGWF